MDQVEGDCFLVFKALSTFPNTFLVLIANVPRTPESNKAKLIIEINAQLDDCISVLESIYSNSIMPDWIKETERVRVKC